MVIAKDHVVELEYTLTDDSGEVLDTSEGGAPLAYLHGFQNIIPGLERELEGKKQGDELKVKVEPADAYGELSEALVNQVSRAELAGIPDLEVGLQLQAETDQGLRVFTVTEIEGDSVTLDGNHPLAGMTLHFDVKVTSVRKASDEEIAHGHVHGPDGHHHH